MYIWFLETELSDINWHLKGFVPKNDTMSSSSNRPASSSGESCERTACRWPHCRSTAAGGQRPCPWPLASPAGYHLPLASLSFSGGRWPMASSSSSDKVLQAHNLRTASSCTKSNSGRTACQSGQGMAPAETARNRAGKAITTRRIANGNQIHLCNSFRAGDASV